MSSLTAKNRSGLDAGQFAFPTQRKVPLENATHVRNAVARFNQLEGATDVERDAAWKRIQSAARNYEVQIHESSWHQLATEHSPSTASKKS